MFNECLDIIFQPIRVRVMPIFFWYFTTLLPSVKC
nr:MAG TPA: hypothetical protein [Caudoviricetes sp.]